MYRYVKKFWSRKATLSSNVDATYVKDKIKGPMSQNESCWETGHFHFCLAYVLSIGAFLIPWAEVICNWHVYIKELSPPYRIQIYEKQFLLFLFVLSKIADVLYNWFWWGKLINKKNLKEYYQRSSSFLEILAGDLKVLMMWYSDSSFRDYLKTTTREISSILLHNIPFDKHFESISLGDVSPAEANSEHS